MSTGKQSDSEPLGKRAIQEVKSHGSDVAEFFTDMGDHETYVASELLEWLGY